MSQRHAEFMAGFFNDRGVRAVAVHSGSTSAPRAASLERLTAGELDIVFCVDMFNEGVDLPTLDTVMMLRPTESKTRHTVALEKHGADWHLRPLGQRTGELQLWRGYSREEIPPLFGLEFSTAIWNVGFVKRPGHIFLLVTLDKAGHATDFQYKDHFVSPAEFEWQSQNRTGQASGDGQDIQKHAARGIAVHLFVRSQKKRAGGGAAPFVYCGDVEFVGWRGEKPITVQWKLPEAVPARLRGDLGVPAAPRQGA